MCGAAAWVLMIFSCTCFNQPAQQGTTAHLRLVAPRNHPPPHLHPQAPQMVKPVESLPPKLPEGMTMDSPHAYYPLTRTNMKRNLEAILRQMHSYDLPQQQPYQELCTRLYTDNAEFHYPIAKLHGRHAIMQFWNLFLLGRWLRSTNVHHMAIDVAWDPEKLQALVQIQSWFHPKALAWVESLIKMPFGKVWSCQVFQFQDFPADGPGALRVIFQEELADQFIYLGTFPAGLYTIRTDEGTPLNWLLNTARSLNGMAMACVTPHVVQLLQALGMIKTAAA